MIKKCLGCGSVLQYDDPFKEGYATSDKLYCKRCFRIKNYGDYSLVNKDSCDYKKIFNEIKLKKDLTLFLCDIFTLDESINYVNNFNGKVILIITKKDLLPKSVKEKKIKNYIKNNYNLKVEDILFVSSNKNYNIDLLLNVIKKNKTSNKVYLVGNTNAGKSSLINALLKSVKKDAVITTSYFPATTLDLINIKLDDDITLIDTPGIISDKNYLTNLVAKKKIKKRS